MPSSRARRFTRCRSRSRRAPSGSPLLSTLRCYCSMSWRRQHTFRCPIDFAPSRCARCCTHKSARSADGGALLKAPFLLHACCGRGGAVGLARASPRGEAGAVTPLLPGCVDGGSAWGAWAAEAADGRRARLLATCVGDLPPCSALAGVAAEAAGFAWAAPLGSVVTVTLLPLGCVDGGSSRGAAQCRGESH